MLLGSVWDGDLLSVATSPNLMLASLAMLDPSVDTGEAFELLVGHALRVAFLVELLPCGPCPCAPRVFLLAPRTLL